MIFRWGTHHYISVLPSICPTVHPSKKLPKIKNNNYMCHGPYLRNIIAYDHDFWYTCVKWWYLQDFFSFFEIFISWDVRWVKGQKIAQNKNCICHDPRWQKNPACCTSHLKSHISYDCHLRYTCVKWWYLQGFFFIFKKILILWVARGWKAKKWSKMRKNPVCNAQYLRNHISYDFHLW